MGQDIKVGVSANTSGLNSVNKGIEQTDRSIKGAEKSLEQLNKQMRETLALASKLTGMNLSESDMMHVHQSTQGFIRRNRNLRNAGQNDIFDLLSGGYTHLNLQNRHDAEKRLSNLIRNTIPGGGSFGTPPGAPPPPSGGGFGGLASSGMSWGRSAIGGMMALAGVGGIMAMAGKAHSMAAEEGVGADALKRMLGDTSTDFDILRNAMRGFAEDIGIGSIEAIKLSQQFAKLAGTAEKGDIAQAGGFARSYGLDPGVVTSFFGQMRRYGITGSPEGNRMLGLQIGEAVARSGSTAKTGEMLDAINGFVSTVAHSSMTQANVGAYASALSGLVGQRIPGLDPSGAASLMAQANAGVIAGGKYGEASQMAWLAAINNHQTKIGDSPLHPMEAEALREAGMFATTRQVFGTERWQNYYKKHGITRKLDDVTLFDKGEAHVQALSGGGILEPDVRRGLFGTNINGSMNLGGLTTSQRNSSAALASRAGVDLLKMNLTGIQDFSELAVAASGGDTEKVKSMAASYLNRKDLTGEEQKLLKTESGDPLIESLARIIHRVGQEQTDETRRRAADADFQNKLTMLGESMVTLTTGIKNTLNKIAEHMGVSVSSDTPQAPTPVGTSMSTESSGPIASAGAGDKKKNRLLANKILNNHDYDHLFKKEAARRGLDWRDLKVIAGMESGFNPNAFNRNENGTTDVGIMQLNSKYHKERGVKNPLDPRENIAVGAGVLAANLGRHKGDLREAVRAYNGSGPKAEAYADKFMAVREAAFGLSSTPLSSIDPTAKEAQAEQRMTFDLHAPPSVAINWPNGQQATEIPLTTSVRRPRPVGLAFAR